MADALWCRRKALARHHKASARQSPAQSSGPQPQLQTVKDKASRDLLGMKLLPGEDKRVHIVLLLEVWPSVVAPII